AGITPLQPQLDQINAIASVQDLLHYITAEYTQGNGFLFSFYVGPDDKNSNVERAHFSQGGLGLPNRNYYFKKGEKSEEIRTAYHDYVAQILKLSTKDENANESATDIINLETKIAGVS